MDPREEILLEIGRSPELAHSVLFGYKHTAATPAFHLEMIRDWHSDRPSVLTMAFRGAAKSTRAEEAIVVQACLQRARNVVILGESEARAVDRLRAIKLEFEHNERITTLFRIGPGSIWTDAKVTLTNGCMLQAYGRGQSLRGMKYLDRRPDLIFLDDIEDEESVRTPEAREKTRRWLASTVIPAMDPGGRIRMAATPLDADALAVLLARSGTWHTRHYPIETVDPATGGRVPTWPERYPLEWIDARREAMAELGMQDQFMQEYMLLASDPATRTFTMDMVKIEPVVRSWHAVYAMYDPARTTNKKSATTGKVVWSWVGNRLVVWEATARKWLPDAIVEDIFDVDRRFSPVAIGVEETGLNEFLMQPLRQQQVLRGQALPLRPLHAPKGKLDFIRALQPFFKAGEVVFAQPLPELQDQLLAFPTGEIDAPNALAYALKMRPGAPVYDDFAADVLVAEPRPARNAPLWLAVHASLACTAAALCQVNDGRLTVFADWLREGGPGDTLSGIVAEAGLEAGTPYRLVAPLSHFSAYDIVGLRAAAARIPVEVRRGGDTVQGREEVRALLRRRERDTPALRVATTARWTARAFAGGYCRSMARTGLLEEQPEPNSYAVLMEGVEAFAALLRSAAARDDSGVRHAISASGQRYITARG